MSNMYCWRDNEAFSLGHLSTSTTTNKKAYLSESSPQGRKDAK